jgi:multiple sugar transport system ATP-binding protein
VAGFLGAPIGLVDRPGPMRARPGPVDRLLPDAPPAARRAGLRPEHLLVSDGGEGVPASVVLAEHLGDSSIVHLRVEGVADLLHAKLGAGGPDRLAPGQAVALQPVPGRAFAFDAAGERVR